MDTARRLEIGGENTLRFIRFILLSAFVEHLSTQLMNRGVGCTPQTLLSGRREANGLAGLHNSRFSCRIPLMKMCKR